MDRLLTLKDIKERYNVGRPIAERIARECGGMMERPRKGKILVAESKADAYVYGRPM